MGLTRLSSLVVISNLLQAYLLYTHPIHLISGVYIGLHEPTLAFAGRRWPTLAVLGLHWPLWIYVGLRELRWPL